MEPLESHKIPKAGRKFSFLARRERGDETRDGDPGKILGHILHSELTICSVKKQIIKDERNMVLNQ